VKNIEQEKHGAYSYYLTDEQLDAFLKLPVRERLRWLEEAQELIYRTYTKEQWKILQQYRREEL
jgi:hypothetical protein